MRANHTIIMALGLAAGLGAGAPGAWAQDAAIDASIGARGGLSDETTIDGKVSVRDVFSTTNQQLQGQDLAVHLIFIDLDLDARNLATFGERGRLNFKLDSRFLNDLTQGDKVSTNEFTTTPVGRNERRFGETQTFADVRDLYVEAEDLGSTDLRLGRVWLYQAGGAWVDGLDLEFKFNQRWSLGGFGGLAPDPFDYLPTAERQTAGSYVAYEADRVQFSTAYTSQLFDGGLDRHYVFSRGHWSVPVEDWGKSLFLSYAATLDLPNSEAGQDDPVLTTFFTNVSWWANNTLNFGANYARFATVRLADPRQRRFNAEENQQELLGQEINQGAYDQVRLSAVQRFSHYHVYQQIDIRDRDLLDKRQAIYYRAGVRDNAFLGTELYLHGAVTVKNNFLSDSTEFLLESAYRFGSKFQVDGAAAFQSGRSLVAQQDQDVIFANLRGTFDFTPDVYLSLDYDLTIETNIQQEEDETADSLLVHTLFTRLTWRF